MDGPANYRCREKQRRETTRLQSVNGKLIAMNKLLMEENERLQKQVSQLMHEKDHLLQHLHIPLAPSPLNLPPPAHLNPNRNIINHNFTNTTTDNHSFNLSPCYVWVWIIWSFWYNIPFHRIDWATLDFPCCQSKHLMALSKLKIPRSNIVHQSRQFSNNPNWRKFEMKANLTFVRNLVIQRNIFPLYVNVDSCCCL